MYNNREREAGGRAAAKSLAVVQGKGNPSFGGRGGGSRSRGPVMQGLSLNQCAYCKQDGH